MLPATIKASFHRSPFHPFKVVCGDGKVYRVDRPTDAWLTVDAIHIGVVFDEVLCLPVRYDVITVTSVVRLESIGDTRPETSLELPQVTERVTQPVFDAIQRALNRLTTSDLDANYDAYATIAKRHRVPYDTVKTIAWLTHNENVDHDEELDFDDEDE